MRSLVLLCVFVLISSSVFASDDAAAREEQAVEQVNALDAPLYNPFVERYVLDELKSLRTDLQAQRTEFATRLASTELGASDRAVTYATSTINNIFYIIAAAASILALVGWGSIREVRHRINEVIEQKVNKISEDYEERLLSLEGKLRDRTESIIAAQEEISRTNTLHSLWMRAGLEATHQAKIEVYDLILSINPKDVEALTYKADEVLELGEAEWSLNLCNKAIAINEEYPYAYYQRACANSTLNHLEHAFEDLKKAVELSSTYLDEAMNDKGLENLRQKGMLEELIETVSD